MELRKDRENLKRECRSAPRTIHPNGEGHTGKEQRRQRLMRNWGKGGGLGGQTTTFSGTGGELTCP